MVEAQHVSPTRARHKSYWSLVLRTRGHFIVDMVDPTADASPIDGPPGAISLRHEFRELLGI